MAYTTFSVPASGTGRGTIASTLATAGFVRVTQDYSPATNYTLDVWRSPAASNAAGVDWYLFVMDFVSASNHFLYLTVAEGWDDATKLASKYSPAAGNVVPAADFSIGTGTAAPTAANLFYVYNLSPWTHANGTSGVLSATPDRVILKINDASGTSPMGLYCGHLDRVYPVSIDPVQPLVAARLDSQSSAPSGVGMVGATTRDPGATTGHPYGFRVLNWGNTAVNQAYVRQLPNYTDSVIGKPWSSRGGPCLGRYYNTSLRGLYKDVRLSQFGVIPAWGDTMTETLPDGSTVSYWMAGISLGYWALAV